jgi:hypothetical protein
MKIQYIRRLGKSMYLPDRKAGGKRSGGVYSVGADVKNGWLSASSAEIRRLQSSIRHFSSMSTALRRFCSPHASTLSLFNATHNLLKERRVLGIE